jgi:hypothetical protein
MNATVPTVKTSSPMATRATSFSVFFAALFSGCAVW